MKALFSTVFVLLSLFSAVRCGGEMSLDPMALSGPAAEESNTLGETDATTENRDAALDLPLGIENESATGPRVDVCQMLFRSCVYQNNCNGQSNYNDVHNCYNTCQSQKNGCNSASY